MQINHLLRLVLLPVMKCIQSMVVALLAAPLVVLAM
jgi:hypothetical protein